MTLLDCLPANAPPVGEALAEGPALARQCLNHRPRLAQDHGRLVTATDA
jgi:hypothetical protein